MTPGRNQSAWQTKESAPGERLKIESMSQAPLRPTDAEAGGKASWGFRAPLRPSVERERHHPPGGPPQCGVSPP